MLCLFFFLPSRLALCIHGINRIHRQFLYDTVRRYSTNVHHTYVMLKKPIFMFIQNVCPNVYNNVARAIYTIYVWQSTFLSSYSISFYSVWCVYLDMMVCVCVFQWHTRFVRSAIWKCQRLAFNSVCYNQPSIIIIECMLLLLRICVRMFVRARCFYTMLSTANTKYIQAMLPMAISSGSEIDKHYRYDCAHPLHTHTHTHEAHVKLKLKRTYGNLYACVHCISPYSRALLR